MIGRRRGGRYTPLEELGRGATAVVYRALDERLRTEVALKVLAPHLTRDRDAIARLRRELSATRAIACPSVAQIYDLGQDDESVYLVLEFGRSGTLKDHLLLHGPLGMGPLDRLMEDLAAALHACHRQGVLHRDLKPSNLLFDPATGGIKLIDFGVARVADSGELRDEPSVVGTAEYMAPEQFSDSVPDPRSDLYAAGVVLYEAATGRSPFVGRTVPEVARRHREGVRVPPRELNPALGRGAEAVILRLLRPDPADRFQTAGELLDALAGRSTIALEADASERLAGSGGCPRCGARREPSLSFCPVCTADLVHLERFGRWSVRVTQAPQEADLGRALDALLPESLERRTPEGPSPDSLPRTVLEFASEPLSRWVAGRLQEQGFVVVVRFLSFPRALLITLFCVVSLNVWLLAFFATSASAYAWFLSETSGLITSWQGTPPDTTWFYSIPLLGGSVVAFALGILRHLRNRFGNALAYVSPVPRPRTLPGPIRRARAAQARLRTRRLRGIGAGLLVGAQRLLVAPGEPPADEPALDDVLGTAFRALEKLDAELEALATLREEPSVRLARQDAVVRGTQALLRLSALWRSRHAARVRARTRALAEALARERDSSGDLEASHADLLQLLEELDALAIAPPTRPAPATA